VACKKEKFRCGGQLIYFRARERLFFVFDSKDTRLMVKNNEEHRGDFIAPRKSRVLRLPLSSLFYINIG
jgi:hypothetical protein